MKHTPTPYIGGHYSSVVGCPIVGQSGELVCDTAFPIPSSHPAASKMKEKAEANAAFIVHACNAHEPTLKLMHQAKRQLSAISYWKKDQVLLAVMGFIDAAIAKAEASQ